MSLVGLRRGSLRNECVLSDRLLCIVGVVFIMSFIIVFCYVGVYLGACLCMHVLFCCSCCFLLLTHAMVLDWLCYACWITNNDSDCK